MTTNGRYSVSDGTSYMDSVLVNGETSHDDNNNSDWCDSYDVNSLLQDAPVDSIRQRMHVEREESIVDSHTLSEDGDREKVDVEFIDGQVQVIATRATKVSSWHCHYKISAIFLKNAARARNRVFSMQR